MADTRTDDGSIHQASGLTIGDLFRQVVATNPDRIALKDRHHALTYAALADRVARLVRALASRGVAPGDRVAILSENRREYVEIQLACAERGAIIACQNWRQADPELECAPSGGQIGRNGLTPLPGLPEDGSHGTTSFTQHRIQTAGRRGIHRG